MPSAVLTCAMVSATSAGLASAASTAVFSVALVASSSDEPSISATTVVGVEARPGQSSGGVGHGSGSVGCSFGGGSSSVGRSFGGGSGIGRSFGVGSSSFAAAASAASRRQRLAAAAAAASAASCLGRSGSFGRSCSGFLRRHVAELVIAASAARGPRMAPMITVLVHVIFSYDRSDRPGCARHMAVIDANEKAAALQPRREIAGSMRHCRACACGHAGLKSARPRV